MQTKITITKRGVQRVRARHRWVYRSDLTEPVDSLPGEIVRVADSTGRTLGKAFYSSRSQIALRMISFEDEEVDRDFWVTRFASAEGLRSQVVHHTTAYRLIYGESDLLPSLIVDRYNDCFAIQTLSQGSDALKQTWVDLLVERHSPRAIVERNEARVRDLEGLARISGVLYGQDPGDLVIEENDVRFTVNLVEGQKTGAFLDQRENRIAAASYARGRVLDCFTYQGGFAMHFAKTADSVLAVDASAQAIAQARKNAELNGLANIEFVEANVFDLLHEMEQAGEQFDVINLDPPAFAKSRSAVEAAARGYKEINLRAMKLLRPGGVLITSTCSYHMSEEGFLNVLAQAAADAGRSGQIIERRMQARDHPVLVSMPETHYLKCVIMRIA